VRGGGMNHLGLRGPGRHMVLAGRSQLRRVRPVLNPARSSVVADIGGIGGVVVHRAGVDVRDGGGGDVNVVDGGVVHKPLVAPKPTLVAYADVSEPIIDA
jgi:hypothetical protein